MSQATSEKNSATERYLRELADGLEALPPADRAEVLAEVRSHLAEATSETGGEEERALAGFGEPSVLATRILQERGVLAEFSGLPDAPRSTRLAAVAIDAARWLLLLWVLLGAVFLYGAAGSPSPLTVALAWTYVAAVVAGTAWWWIRTRRQRGHVSAGMNVMGLRRVRVGEASRLVRATDIGEPKRARSELAGTVIWTLLLLLVVASLGYGLISSVRGQIETTHQQEIQAAAQDALEAEHLVTELYDATLRNEAASSTWFTPEAGAAATDLTGRHNLGGFDSYSIIDVQLPDYHSAASADDVNGYEGVVLLDVNEFQKNTYLRIGDLPLQGRAPPHTRVCG
jgi:uncharacterized membrane protein